VVILGVVSQATNVLALRSLGPAVGPLRQQVGAGRGRAAVHPCIAAMVGASQIHDRSWVMAYLVACTL
jgi:hypothetical protein